MAEVMYSQITFDINIKVISFINEPSFFYYDKLKYQKEKSFLIFYFNNWAEINGTTPS